MAGPDGLTVRSGPLRAPEVELGQAVRDLVGHQIEIDGFIRQFLVSRIYALCPVRPGLFVMSRPGACAIVPVWSTVRSLRHVMGRFDWLACSGQEVVANLPDGVDVLIDDGMPCSITLPFDRLLAQVSREHPCGS